MAPCVLVARDICIESGWNFTTRCRVDSCRYACHLVTRKRLHYRFNAAIFGCGDFGKALHLNEATDLDVIFAYRFRHPVRFHVGRLLRGIEFTLLTEPLRVGCSPTR